MLRRNSSPSKLRLALAVGSMIALAIAVHIGLTGQLPFLHRVNVWSIAIYEGESPFDLHPTHEILALTAEQVDDVPALFVADPFLYQHQGQQWMFFELLNQSTSQGDIGVARQTEDGRWHYEQIVLDESFHLSYPRVFAWEGEIYLVPESAATDEVRLYRAAQFPYQWEFVRTLVRQHRLADPTLFRHEGRWWMFAGESHTHDRLRLYHAEQLEGPWVEHVESPLRESSPDLARPGGSVFQWQGKQYRLGQDCSPKYGRALNAFEIEEIDESCYRELPGQHILSAGDAGWNSAGMHHADLYQLDNGRWVAAVDGHQKRWILKFGLP